MIKTYESEEHTENDPKEILIAPSWQKDNLIDLCIDQILDQLLGKGYHVTLRPHPQYVRHFMDKLMAIKEKYSDRDDFTLQTDFLYCKIIWNKYCVKIVKSMFSIAKIYITHRMIHVDILYVILHHGTLNMIGLKIRCRHYNTGNQS